MSRRSGSGNCAGSAVGRADADVDARVGGQLDASHLDFLRRDAVAELHGAVEAQELLDRRLEQLDIVCLGEQSSLLLRPFGKREQRVADEVGRGLVAGVEQEDAVESRGIVFNLTVK